MSAGIFAHWPNRITALRFVGALVLFAILAVTRSHRPDEMGAAVPVCFWLFIVIALTDVVDGYLARRDNLITAFGRIADPFVDKILVLGTMIFLAGMDWSRTWFPAWLVVVVLSREFLVTGLRGYVESVGKEFPADWSGKLKMLSQCFAVSSVLGIHAFPWPEEWVAFLSVVAYVFVGATLVATLLSGTQYVARTKRLLAESTT